MNQDIVKHFYDPLKTTVTRPVSCIVIGGGNRGARYCEYAKDFPHLVSLLVACQLW